MRNIIDTIEFKDFGEGGRGVLIVSQCGEQVALCLTLEENGDYEVFIEKEVAERLAGALRRAVAK